MSRHRREALRCVGCNRHFSNMGAFDVHKIRHKHSEWGDSSSRCANEAELEESPELRKVGGIWFKSGKDV